MISFRLFLVFLTGTVLTACFSEPAKQAKPSSETVETTDTTLLTPLIEYDDDKLQKLRKLVKAYPDFINGFEGDSILLWKDGTRMLFDDGVKNKTYRQMLDNADIEDMFFFEYPKDSVFIFEENYDPGRIRNEPFFAKMYGSSSADVSKNLVKVQWLPGVQLRATQINNISDKIQSIADELSKKPHLKKYLTTPGGTFNWRKISGTDRLSCHSFGIAIDINVKYSDYWKWSKGKNGKPKYQNKIPYEIAAVFEKYGFIWGGKWTTHFDTMHFEYRPELLIEL